MPSGLGDTHLPWGSSLLRLPTQTLATVAYHGRGRSLTSAVAMRSVRGMRAAETDGAEAI